MVLMIVGQLGRVVEPEAHGTHYYLQAVKPGCREPAALAGLGRLRALIQRTNETWEPRIKRSGPPSTSLLPPRQRSMMGT
jgi:hypothetical protein